MTLYKNWSTAAAGRVAPSLPNAKRSYPSTFSGGVTVLAHPHEFVNLQMMSYG